MNQFSQQFRYLRSRFGGATALALPAPADPQTSSDSALAAATPAVGAPEAAAVRRKSVLAHPSMGALLIAVGAVVGAKFIASTDRPSQEPVTIAAPTQSYKIQAAQTGATPPIAKQTAERPADRQAGRADVPAAVGATPVTASAPAKIATNAYFPEPKAVRSVTTDGRGRVVDPAPTGSVAKSTLSATAPAPAVRVELPPEAPVNLSVVERAPARLTPLPTVPPVAQDQRAPANVVDSARFGRSGGVSIQFAAAGSEDEARFLAERLQQRFSYELEGRTLAIIPAKPRDRLVYRLRLTEISRDEADAICAVMRANRAGCFVAKD